MKKGGKNKTSSALRAEDIKRIMEIIDVGINNNTIEENLKAEAFAYNGDYLSAYIHELKRQNIRETLIKLKARLKEEFENEL